MLLFGDALRRDSRDGRASDGCMRGLQTNVLLARLRGGATRGDHLSGDKNAKCADDDHEKGVGAAHSDVTEREEKD